MLTFDRFPNLVVHDAAYCYKLSFSTVDVAWHKSQRRKRISLFENVNAVILVAAMSEYDKMMWEDDCKVGQGIHLMEGGGDSETNPIPKTN